MSFGDFTKVSDLSTNIKENISTLKINNIGDKVGACDSAGNFFLWKFDLKGRYRLPIYSLFSS